MQETEDPPWPVRVHTFGHFAIAIDNVRLEADRAAQRKPIELLKATIALGIQGVEVRKLLALLWPDAPLPAARRNFDTALHRLRRLAPKADWLALHDGRLSLDPAIAWVDTLAFSQVCDRVTRAVGANDEPAVNRAVAQLLRLYQGDFLARDTDRPWALQARDRERTRFIDVLAKTGAYFEAAEAWPAAEELYKRGLAVDNLSEPFFRGLIRSLLARGESAEALKVFRRCRELLSIVLNLQPTAETQALVRDIYDFAERELPLPDKPSIAVLPFANMSADPGQEYLADGVTQDIITALSRFHSLFVISRNSTFTYKGKATDVRTVARELGVRYVVEGSIRRDADRVRVAAQLIDAVTSSHLWAERFDRATSDIFSLQEELTRNIVASIAPEIESAERAKARRRRPESSSAYEIAVRAWANSYSSWTNSDKLLRDQAIRDAEAALAIDPASTLALNALSFAKWQNLLFRTTDDLEGASREARRAAERAIELDRSDSVGYTILGLIHCAHVYTPGTTNSANQYDEALACFRRAHDLNPNDAFTLHTFGYCEVLIGNTVEGSEHLLQSLRNNPRDPWRSNTIAVLCLAGFISKDYASGIEWGLSAARETPGMANIQIFLAMNYVGLREIEKAKTAVEAAFRLAPELIQSRLDGFCSYKRLEDRRRQHAFLRIAAGLEDPSAADQFR